MHQQTSALRQAAWVQAGMGVVSAGSPAFRPPDMQPAPRGFQALPSKWGSACLYAYWLQN